MPASIRERGQKEVKKAYDKFQKTSTTNKLIMAALIAFFLVAIYAIFYYYYQQRASQLFIKQPLFMTDIDKGKPHNAKYVYYYRNKPFIPGDLVRTYNSTQYTYSFWIYVNALDWGKYKFGDWKHIFHRGTQPVGELTKISEIKIQTPGFWLAPKTNRLICAFNNEQATLEDIELNKWLNITVVLDNRSVSLYKNGKLERTVSLQKRIDPNNNNLYINYFNGFSGWMTYLQFYNRALSPGDVYSYYKRMKSKMDKFMKGHKEDISELTTDTEDVKPYCQLKNIEESEKEYSYDKCDI